MFGETPKCVLSPESGNVYTKMIGLKEWGGAGCSSDVKILIPFHSLPKPPLIRETCEGFWKPVQNGLMAVVAKSDRVKDQVRINSSGALRLVEQVLERLVILSWSQEKRNVNAFSQLKDIKNIQGPTWKYIVSVSRARWRRHPAPVEVRFLSSTWFHNFYRSCFSLWYTFKEADSHSAKTTFVLLNHSLDAVHLRGSRPPLYATC